MSFLLAQWLNKDLGVSRQVAPTDLDSVLTSGGLLGEILNKLELIEDQGDYIQGSSLEASIRNYTLAERVLKDRLGIPLSSNEAFDLIQGRAGCAAKLLYQIKAAHSRLPLGNPLDQRLNFKLGSNKREESGDMASYPASPTGLPPRMKKSEAPSKIQQYKEKEHAFFADLLKAKLHRFHRARQTYPAFKSQQEETKKINSPAQNATLEWALDASLPKAPLVKTKRVAVIKNPFKLKEVLEQKEREEAAKNLEKMNAAKERERRVWEELRAKEKRARQAQSFVDQIDQFESKVFPHSSAEAVMQNAETLGNGDVTSTSAESPRSSMAQYQPRQTSSLKNDSTKRSTASPNDEFPLSESDKTQIIDFIQRAKMDSFTHLKTLNAKLPAVQVSHQQTAAYLASIKAQKRDEEVAKKERDLRRRRLLLSEQVAQEDLEKSKMDELMAQKLQRHSKQERRIAEQLMLVRHEKQVIKENRIAREIQYAERRQQDYVEAIEREFELAERAREEFKKQTALKLAQHLEILEAKKAAKHEKNIGMVSGLVSDLLELSLKIAEYRSLNDNHDLPLKLTRQWKTLFLHEQPVYKEFEIPADKEKVAPKEELQQIEPELGLGAALLDDAEFKEYLGGLNEWTYTLASESQEPPTPASNAALAVIVDDVLAMSTDVKPVEPSVTLPHGQMKLAILGKPFSGKSSLASSLAVQHNLKIVDVNALIKEALSLSTSASTKTSAAGLKDRLQSATKGRRIAKDAIGAKLQQAMLEGAAPDDSLLMALVLDSIKDGEAQGHQGWVLTDFPKNRTQALLLEKELTGYVEPAPVTPGNLKRSNSRARQYSEIHKQPYVAKPEEENPKSGLDCVLWLDVSNEASFKRALGQRVDSLTQVKYHLVDAPPPLDEPGLQERLVDTDEDAESKKQLHFEIAHFENNETPLRALYEKFSNLKIFNAAKMNDWTLQEVNKNVCEIIEAKQIVPIPPGDPTLVTLELGDPCPGSENKVALEAPLNASSNGGRPETATKEQPPLISSKTASSIALPYTIHHPSHMVRNVQVDGRKFTTKELATILADDWVKTESSYTNKVKFLFRAIRKEKEEALHYFHNTKKNFKKFLERPDRKQDLIDLFQKEYNAIEEDFRSDGDVKAELHHRVDDLREKLWDLSDVKKEEADAERLSVIEDRWVEDHSVVIQNVYIAMIQAEVDQYLGTKQFLNDYFKDAYGSVISENRWPSVTVPFASQPAPIDIATPLAAHHQDYLSKRSANTKKSISPATVPPVTKDTRTSKAAMAQAISKPIIDIAVPNVPVKKTYPIIEHAAIPFVELQAAVDAALLAIVDPSEPNGEVKEKKDKKKTPSVEAYKVPDFVPPPEYTAAIDRATDLFKKNISRIAMKAKEHVLELMDKGLASYTHLDEMVGARFTGEMEAIRRLLLVIKEAIEAEVKLPNYLELSGDNFNVNFSVLTVDPEPVARPESPVEKPNYYQFTCLQLLNYSRQFREIAPSGLLSSKEFVDSMLRYNNLSAGTQLVPEMLNNLDVQALQQICAILDSFETGFVSWRKYLYIHSRVLPAPSVNYLVNLQAIFKSCPSYENGKISYADFASIPLWFSEAAEAVQEGPARFNRQLKLRNAVFCIFSTKKNDASETSTGGVSLVSEHQAVDFTSDLFDTEAFLFHSCLDETASQGLEKAFYIQSEASDGYCTVQDLFKIFHFTMPLVPETHRLAEEESVNEPYPMEFLEKLFESLGVEKTIHFDDFIKVTKNYAVSLYSCPLYLLDDVTILKSRPSTSEKTGSA